MIVFWHKQGGVCSDGPPVDVAAGVRWSDERTKAQLRRLRRTTDDQDAQACVPGFLPGASGPVLPLLPIDML